MSILEYLAAERVVAFFIAKDGKLAVCEECDCCFSVGLDKDQTRQLIAELTELYEKML